MKLETYISELLHDHNCVIVPDFGGFVANYKSAVIDEFRKKIYPPSKSVLFNPLLTNNDGLLANHISRTEDITYSDALDDIYMGVNDWNKRFQEGERIEIGEIGFLYRSNGKVQFEQSRDVNLLLQAFGLRSVNFITFDEKVEERKPVKETKRTVETEVVPLTNVVQVEEKVKEEERTEIKEVPVKEEKKEKEEKEIPVFALNQEEEIETIREDEKVGQDATKPKRRLGREILKYAAAAAIVPVLFYSYWIPVETDALETKSIQFSDFNPIHQQVEKKYKHRDSAFEIQASEHPINWDELTENINATVYSLEVSEDFFVSVKLERSPDVVEENTESEVNVNTTEQVVVSGNYQIIAGCFSVKGNADNHIKDLTSDGFEATIFDKSGSLHRVTAGGFNSREDANAGLEKLKNAGHDGWILKN